MPPAFQHVLGTGAPLPGPPPPARAPICFEPPVPLIDHPELWVVTTGPGPDWPGCHVLWSEDGDDYHGQGGEYVIGSGAVCGRLLTPWPAKWGAAIADGWEIALDDLGTLPMADVAAARRLQTLCYVGGDSGGYELIAYTGMRLLGKDDDAAHRYRMDGLVIRGAYGTPVLEHPAGSRFARLDGHVARIPLPHRLLMGPSTLYLRLLPVDTLGDEHGLDEDEAGVAPLRYTLRNGWAGGTGMRTAAGG